MFIGSELEQIPSQTLNIRPKADQEAKEERAVDL